MSRVLAFIFVLAVTALLSASACGSSKPTLREAEATCRDTAAALREACELANALARVDLPPDVARFCEAVLDDGAAGAGGTGG